MVADEITLKDLELDFIKARLKEFAQTKGVREADFKFFDSREEIEREYLLVSEAITIISNNEDIPLDSLGNIMEPISRIKKGGIISGAEIITIRDMILLARHVRSFIRSKRNEYPNLYKLLDGLEKYDDLFMVINKTIDDKGLIRDDCSEKLGDLRRDVKRIRERIIEIIDNYLREPDYQKMIMDSYYTIRNNRYVLPIRTQFKGSIKGIIHGSSNTGETLFIEPEPIINLGNELVFAESLVMKEEENILRGLCIRISEFVDQLVRDYESLSRLDEIFAKARYSMKINGNKINVGQDINVVNIRHPILVFKNLSVVPNTLSLNNNIRGVVISGPNAGGKTVLLKAVGLALLHMKMGLFYPVGEKSSMPLFNRIYSCFGDAQNLEQGLSTFSGHIKRLKYIIENCSRDDLVLLDEIASDTDPKEGSALSAAIIEHIIQKGSYVFVTTHFHELRLWASKREDVINVAMEFDPVMLKPTYRLILGVSGESYTLRIAKDMGIPDEIIEKANSFLGKEYREYLEIYSLVKLRERELSEKIAEIERERQKNREEFELLVEKEKLDYQRRIDELVKKRTQIIEELEAFYKKVSVEIARIQKESDMKRAVSLQKEIKDFISANTEREISTQNNKIEDLKIGDVVVVERLGAKGAIVEHDIRRGRYLINVNGKNLWIDSREVRKIDEVELKVMGNNKPQIPNQSVDQIEPIEGVKEVDVRGLYLDDAISEIEKELDYAYRKSYSSLKIIHGHGTGSLKNGIRRYLRQSIYVSAFRPADLSDGGDGVTIVEIRKD
ncbi:MAG: endonuclease MutS2 [Deltaproteobacteria bacterium]|nr:endonuclease MutS2 [Deltaproteobacteria bacterium]